MTTKVTEKPQEDIEDPQEQEETTKKLEENEEPAVGAKEAIKSRKTKRLEKRAAKVQDANKEEEKEKTPEEIEKEAQERFDLAQTMTGKVTPPYVHLRDSEPYRLKMGNDIKVDDYTLQVPGKTLLKSASFSLAFGHRYGVVGRNGTGKSTLLKRIAEKEGIVYSGHLRVLYVEQEVPGDDTVPIDYVLKSDNEREWLLKEEAILIKLSEDDPFWMDNPDEKRSYSLKDVQERLFDIQSAKATPRAATILAGLGFEAKREIYKKPTREYSGGWRMRIALARALFCRPDVLLLDEPTNHLDLHACIWLEQYLAKWKSTLLVVSHEANFLNEVVDRIIEIRAGKLTTYKGNYWTYLNTRDIVDKTIKKEVTKIEKENERTARSTGKRGTREVPASLQIIKDDPSLRVSFPEPDLVAPPIIQFQEAAFGYNESKTMFNFLDFSIDMETRAALVGLNGVGKSTLMKLMVGELTETNGYVFRNRKARIAKFSQHSLEQLNPNKTPVEYMEEKFKIGSEAAILGHLGRFAISGTIVHHKIKTLSGGQKSRVVLAELAWARPHVLFLDEPSNHLDLDAIEALAHGLNKFEGGIVLITHNQRLISAVCSEIWVVTPTGRVEKFHGDFEDYKAKIIEKMGSLGHDSDEEKKEKEKEKEKEKAKASEKNGKKPEAKKPEAKKQETNKTDAKKPEPKQGKAKEEKGGKEKGGKEKGGKEKGGKEKVKIHEEEKGGGKKGRRKNQDD